MQFVKKNESISVILVIIVVTCLLVFGSYVTKTRNEKTFQFDSCKRCSGNNCVPEMRFTKFKVTTENIETYYISYGAENKIVRPSKNSEKCEILKDKNFAFTCNSYEKLDDKNPDNTYTSSVIFDGGNQYQETSTTESSSKKLTSSVICTVK